MTPEAARMIEEYRQRLKRDWTRIVKRRTGVGDLDDLVPEGGVSIQVRILGTSESGVKKKDEVVEVVSCDGHLPPFPEDVDYLCVKISWKQDYTINVEFDVSMVWNRTNGAVLRKHLSRFTQHFGVKDEARMEVVVDCDMEEFASLPKDPARLSASELMQQVPASALSLQLTLPGHLVSVEADVPVPVEMKVVVDDDEMHVDMSHSIKEHWSYPGNEDPDPETEMRKDAYIKAFHNEGLDMFFKTLRPLFEMSEDS